MSASNLLPVSADDDFVARAKACCDHTALHSFVQSVGPSAFLDLLCRHASEFSEFEQLQLWKTWSTASAPVDMATAVTALFEHFFTNRRMWTSLSQIRVSVDCERLAAVLAALARRGVANDRVWLSVFASDQVKSAAHNHPTFLAEVASGCRSSSVFDAVMRDAWGYSFAPPPDMLCRVLRNTLSTIAYTNRFMFQYLMSTNPMDLDADVLEAAVKYLPECQQLSCDCIWGLDVHPKWFDHTFIYSTPFGIHCMLRQRELHKWLETHKDWATRKHLTYLVESQSMRPGVSVQEIIRILKTYATPATRPVVSWSVLHKWCWFCLNRPESDQEFIDMLRELAFEPDLVAQMDEFCAQKDVMKSISPAIKQFLLSLHVAAPKREVVENNSCVLQ